jgi:hypothetical protein
MYFFACDQVKIAVLDGQTKKNEILGGVVSLKYRFVDIIKNLFFSAKEAENYSAGTGDHSNRRFPDQAQVAFGAC